MKHPDTRPIQLGTRPQYTTVDEFARLLNAEARAGTITAEQFKRALCRAIRETDLPLRMPVPVSIEITAIMEDVMQVEVAVRSKESRWDKKYLSLSAEKWDKLEPSQ